MGWCTQFSSTSFHEKKKIDDLCFFYHTENEKKIVGIVKIIKPYYPDPNNETFGIVDIQTICSTHTPLSLRTIKEDKQLNKLLLIKQSRLSIVPIDRLAFFICVK